MNAAPQDHNWVLIENGGPFTHQSGEFYWAWEGAESGEPPRFGFRVEQRHCNLRPICHGGMLATFVDVVMARGLILAGGVSSPVPTVSLSMDYLAPAPLGEWVEAIVEIDRVSGMLGFVRTTLHVSDTMILRANGVFRHWSKGASAAR